jgi:hypothetical protein
VTLVLVTAPSHVLVNAADEPVGSPYHTFATLACFYLATTYALRILLRVTTKLLYPMLVWLMASWLLPIGIDYVRWWIRGEFSEPMIGRTSCFGALGAMVQIWTGDAQVANLGIAFQAILAAATAAAYYATGRRRIPKPPPSPT